MNGWLLDTNIVSEFGRKRPSVRVAEWFSGLPRRRTFLSILTIAELEQGIEALPLADPQRTGYRIYCKQVEAEFAHRILPLSDDVVRLWGVLRGRRLLAGLGRAAPMDALLAATAVHHGLYLATRNVKDMNGLTAVTFDPWKDDLSRFPPAR